MEGTLFYLDYNEDKSESELLYKGYTLRYSTTRVFYAAS